MRPPFLAYTIKQCHSVFRYARSTCLKAPHHNLRNPERLVRSFEPFASSGNCPRRQARLHPPATSPRSVRPMPLMACATWRPACRYGCRCRPVRGFLGHPFDSRHEPTGFFRARLGHPPIRCSGRRLNAAKVKTRDLHSVTSDTMDSCARLITDIWLPFGSDICRQAFCPVYDYQSQRPVSTGLEAPRKCLFTGGMSPDWHLFVFESD